MNWTTKVDERTKQKIELLYREFDKFIEQNHNSSISEDSAILKQWSNFKQLIDKNPTDFESMHQYLNKLKQEDKSQLKLTKENSTPVRKNSGLVIEINRVRLKKISVDIMNVIGRNNKQLFRV